MPGRLRSGSSIIQTVVGQQREVVGIPAQEPPLQAAHPVAFWWLQHLGRLRSGPSCAGDVLDPGALGSGPVAGSSLTNSRGFVRGRWRWEAPPLLWRLPGQMFCGSAIHKQLRGGPPRASWIERLKRHEESRTARDTQLYRVVSASTFSCVA